MALKGRGDLGWKWFRCCVLTQRYGEVLQKELGASGGRDLLECLRDRHAEGTGDMRADPVMISLLAGLITAWGEMPRHCRDLLLIRRSRRGCCNTTNNQTAHRQNNGKQQGAP